MVATLHDSLSGSVEPLFPEFKIIYDRENRNLDQFPLTQINQLALAVDSQLDEQNQILPRLREFLDQTYTALEAGLISNEEFNIAGHATCSVLLDCLEKNEPWAALFLFKPILDPRVELLECAGQEMTAIESFSYNHQQLSMRQSSEMQMAAFNEPGVMMITGPMYSFKSGNLTLLDVIMRQRIGEKKVHTFILDEIGEKAIHARSLAGQDIPAEQASLKDLISITASIPNNSGHIIIIEEATFYTDAKGLADLIHLLVNRGIKVIISGLNTNYLSQELPLITELSEMDVPKQEFNCVSYNLHMWEGEKRVKEASLTSRYNIAMGEMYDWFLPMFVPREYGRDITDYHPCPAEYHPMHRLNQVDTEMFNRVVAIGRQDLLLKLVEIRDATPKES